MDNRVDPYAAWLPPPTQGAVPGYPHLDEMTCAPFGPPKGLKGAHFLPKHRKWPFQSEMVEGPKVLRPSTKESEPSTSRVRGREQSVGRLKALTRMKLLIERPRTFFVLWAGRALDLDLL